MTEEKKTCKMCGRETNGDISYEIQSGDKKGETVYLCSQEHYDLLEYQDLRILGKVSGGQTLAQYKGMKEAVANEKKLAELQNAEAKKKLSTKKVPDGKENG